MNVVLSTFIVCTLGYQDQGGRQSFWPPLNPASKLGKSTAKLDPCNFSLIDKSTGHSDIAIAIGLYPRSLLFPGSNCSEESSSGTSGTSNGGGDDGGSGAMLTGVQIVAADASIGTGPKQSTDESFMLNVPSSTSVRDSTNSVAILTANTYVGVLRGLERVSQLIVATTTTTAATTSSTTTATATWFIPNCPVEMTEAPHFPHRGVLVDPARSFLTVPALKRVVDGLLYSSMNVLHLHLTDSQSIALSFPSVPELHSSGAYSAAEFYSAQDIAELVTYAANRGVRLVPEVDSPGHARAWGLSQKYASITACSEVPGGKYTKYCAEPPCGQLNPAVNLTYDVVEKVLTDVSEMFPDELVHLGYDEINFACWQDDKVVAKYMKENGLTPPSLLAEYFGKQKALLKRNKRSVYWEEAALQKPALQGIDETSIIQVWSNKQALRAALDTTKAEILVSWSENYYLDCGLGNLFGDQSWCDPFKTGLQMYEADPLQGFDSDADKARAVGGETAAWGELINSANVETRIFPRASAYGGRLWSYTTPVSSTEALLGLEEHSKRLRSRGVGAGGVTLRFCTLNPKLCYGSSGGANGIQKAGPVEQQ